jgi:hypothetical protein
VLPDEGSRFADGFDVAVSEKEPVRQLAPAATAEDKGRADTPVDIAGGIPSSGESDSSW